MNEEITYLAMDGNWGDAAGLLVFRASDIPDDLWDLMADDPEAAYEDIRSHLVKMGKI